MNTERTTQAAAAVPHHGMQRVLQQNLIVLFLVERGLGGPENRPEYILLSENVRFEAPPVTRPALTAPRIAWDPCLKSYDGFERLGRLGVWAAGSLYYIVIF